MKRSRTGAGSSSGFPPTETRAFNTGNASPTSPAAKSRSIKGLCTTAATSIRARQRVAGRRGPSSGVGCAHRNAKPRISSFPTAPSAEQCGDTTKRPDPGLVRRARGHPRRARQSSRDGPRPSASKGWDKTFSSSLESSLEPTDAQPAQPEPPLSQRESPRAHAEAILAAARRDGDREKEATALTDLGVIHLNEGDAQARSRLSKSALAITRELGDTARESDVVGNLGMAMLAVRQPERARSLFEQELAHARATGDRFAEKVALERLGIASWNLRDFSGALEFFEQALSLTRQLGDRHQEANLLWHQGNPACGARPARASDRQGGRGRSPSSEPWEGRRPPRTAPTCRNTAWGLSTIRRPRQPPGVTVDRSPQAYLGGSMVASVMAGQSNAESRLHQGDGAGPACSAWPCRPPRPWPASPARASRPRQPRLSGNASRHARSASTTPVCAARSAAALPTSRAGCSTKTARSASGRRDQDRRRTSIAL